MPQWPARQLDLTCFPPVPEHVSLPWNSADELLLEHAAANTPTLIFNDRHGALGCALPEAEVWTDSFCAAQALEANATHNDIERAPARQWLNLATLTDIKQVLIQIPKTHDLLKLQLSLIQRHWPEATVYLAGMAKHVPVALLNWLENNAVHYEQSRVIRKARSVTLKGLSGFASANNQNWAGYTCAGLSLNGLPGVFCRDRADMGSQVLLEHLPEEIAGKVCDLGCGNGLLALTVKQRFPGAEVIAVDDSEFAVLSTLANARDNNLELKAIQSNALSEVDTAFDWILCNPPFHDGHRQLTQIADTMFRDAAAHLTPDGTLMVVANRHLPYYQSLKRLFSKVDALSADKRFTVYRCQNRH